MSRMRRLAPAPRVEGGVVKGTAVHKSLVPVEQRAALPVTSVGNTLVLVKAAHHVHRRVRHAFWFGQGVTLQDLAAVVHTADQQRRRQRRVPLEPPHAAADMRLAEWAPRLPCVKEPDALVVAGVMSVDGCNHVFTHLPTAQ